MTLIAVYNSEGCVGRCDARCYNAICPDCDCICGGKNHSAGLSKAAENTQAMALKWIEQYAIEHKDNLSGPVRYEIPGLQAALPIF